MPTTFTLYHAGAATPASADAAGIMAALATLFAVANDVDTAAVISGMTWTRDTTAGSQAIYSNAFGPRNSRIIIAVHDSGTPSPSPQMIVSADTYTAANVLIGLCDNAAGAYAGWNQAAPFSGCTFPGYYRLGPTASATTGEIRAWVSTRNLWLQYRQGTTMESCCAGAVLLGNTGYQESDGFRYGLMVSGATGDMSSTWRSNTPSTAGYFGKNNTSNGNAHAGVYAVGASTWVPLRMEHVRIGSATNDMAKWYSATSPHVASNTGISFQKSASPENSLGTWLGVSDGPAAITAARVDGAGAVLAGWVFGSSYVTTNEDSIYLWKSFTGV